MKPYLENPTEPLVGFRFWYPVQKITPRSVFELVRHGDNPKQVKLKSIGNDTFWRPGENHATCAFPMLCGADCRVSHKAPSETGRCGFYSYDRLHTVDEYVVYLAENSTVQRVYGATLNYGDVIVGTFQHTGMQVPLKTGPRGLMYRSEFSKIIAIMDTGPIARLAANHYGVHCVPEKYFEMACREFGKKLNSQEAEPWLND